MVNSDNGCRQNCLCTQPIIALTAMVAGTTILAVLVLLNESSAETCPTPDTRLRLTGMTLVLQTTSQMDSTPEPYVKRIDS